MEKVPEQPASTPTPSSSESDTERQLQLLTLRAKITQAEVFKNEKEVLLLEAELRALENGEHFNRAEYLSKQVKIDSGAVEKKTPMDKKGVLRQMQNFKGVTDDTWSWDGSYAWSEKEKTYNVYFGSLLEKFGCGSFEDLVQKRVAELDRSITVLDLFGGAFFLSNLGGVSRIIGARLQNTDDYVKSQNYRAAALVYDQRREILEGSLYEGKAWKQLSAKMKAEGIEGFDLITCRPQGPFGHDPGPGIGSSRDIKESGTHYRQEIYVALLNRALGLLSSEGGMLFVQQPVLYTHPDDARAFWEQFVHSKQRDGYTFYFDTEDPGKSTRIVVQKGSTSGPKRTAHSTKQKPIE